MLSLSGNKIDPTTINITLNANVQRPIKAGVLTLRPIAFRIGSKPIIDDSPPNKAKVAPVEPHQQLIECVYYLTNFYL